MNEYLVITFLLIILNVIAIFILTNKSYFSTVVNISLFSLISALLYLMLKAPDVGLTEAAIGVCISTVILLACVTKLKEEKTKYKISFFGIIISLIFFVSMIYVSFYLPEFGSAKTAANSSEIINFYETNTEQLIGIKSIVAAILASFRGFDTFGETLVIFTAMLSVLMILKIKKRKVDHE